MDAAPAPPGDDHAAIPRSALLIVGLGNILMADDGVGIHAVRALQDDPPPGARVLEVGTAVLDALPWIAAAERLLALDAIQAGGAPGAIYRVDPPLAAPATAPTSLHELDLPAALRIHGVDRAPPLTVVGVEPARIDFGLELSAVVQAVLPDFLAEVRRLAAELLRAPAAPPR